jgi:excisionase family DNA binding protein
MTNNAGAAAVETFIAELFLTTSQAARFLECGEEHVRKLADAGTIRVAKTPSGWRLFPRSELERFRRERSVR